MPRPPRRSRRAPSVLLLLSLLLAPLDTLSEPAAAQGGDAAHRIYLPWTLQSQSLIGAEALALAGDRAYLGYGPHLITYDISRPGQARRLESRPSVEGRIVHIAVGSDRLFSLSRPDFHAGMPWKQAPWSILSIFDLSDPDAPQQLDQLQWLDPNLYALDLAAKGRVAYLSMTSPEESRRTFGPPFGDVGILVVDASTPSAEPRWLSSSLGSLYYRLLVLDGRLHAHAQLSQSLPGLIPGLSSRGPGIVSFDLTNAAEPRHVGSLSLAPWPDLVGSFSMTGTDQSLYQIYHLDGPGYAAALLRTDVDSSGHPSLGGSIDGQFPARLPKLEPALDLLDRSIFHIVSQRESLYALNGIIGRIFIIDLDGSVIPQDVSSLDLASSGIDLGQRGAELWRTTSLGDTGSTLVADPSSDRLFLASGQHGALVEIDASDPSHLTVTGIYPAAMP